jgi:dipeptidyl aminopeptidase/acylaminoacyl peptidase
MGKIALIVAISICTAAAADGDVRSRLQCPKITPADAGFVCERVVYSSGGIDVSAYLYRSAVVDGALPVVVYNRGGYVIRDGSGLLPALRAFGEAGFLVIAPLYRGSDGTAGHDEMGGADLADLHNVIPLLRNLGGADLRNTFLFGESRGGVMCFLALRDGFPAKAAATVGAFSDLGEYIKGDPRIGPVLPVVWPKYEHESSEIHRTRSAIRWAERLRTPLLLMHGGADTLVSPLHSLRLAERLQMAGTPYSVVVIAGGDHTLSSKQAERDRLVIQWFRSNIQR